MMLILKFFGEVKSYYRNKKKHNLIIDNFDIVDCNENVSDEDKLIQF